MSEASRVRTRRCGCGGTPRRRCELCDPDRQLFLACSAACVDRHRREAHGPAGAGDTAARLLRGQEALNQARPVDDRYRAHRERLARLLLAAQRGEGLCVLGAGNCDDLDLPALAREFGQVHLVDLDGQALAAAVARLPEPTRRRVSVQGGVDLSGTIALVDRWGDELPGDAALAAFASATPEALRAAIGGGDRLFDVVLSTCLLSQLYLPLRESLILGMADWQRLFAAIDRAHLATVAALTRPGGTGVVALDVTTSLKLPELAAVADPATWPGLAAVVDQAIRRRGVELSPDPARLLRLLSAPLVPGAAAVERPRLTDPWVWQTGESVSALVYALVWSSAG